MPCIDENILDSTVSQFLRLYPDAGFLLDTIRTDFLAPSEEDALLAEHLTLRARLRQYGGDPDMFLQLLAEHLDQAAAAEPAQAALWVEANVPCALKAPLEIALAQAVEAARGEDGVAFRMAVQSENESAITNRGAEILGPQEMPDLTVAAGYNTLLDQSFRQRLATAEHFAARPRLAVNARLAGAGFADPLGIYRVIGINVFVFVIDPSRQNGRRPPDTWEALLTEDFVRDVAVCGAGDKVSGSLMLHIQACFGEAAVRAMGRNVRAGMHPSQVIKHLGTGSPQNPAVAVMPYFFARLADIRHPATVVWPRDGAPAMPFFQLVKRHAPPALERFAAALEGPEVGRVCSGALFPSIHPDVPCPLPEEANLAWLGWDYIRRHDLAALRERASVLFDEGRGELSA